MYVQSQPQGVSLLAESGPTVHLFLHRRRSWSIGGQKELRLLMKPCAEYESDEVMEVLNRQNEEWRAYVGEPKKVVTKVSRERINM